MRVKGIFAQLIAASKHEVVACYRIGKKVMVKDRGSAFHGLQGKIVSSKAHATDERKHRYKVKWSNGRTSTHYHHELKSPPGRFPNT